MLDEDNHYRLRNTGQGLNRIQVETGSLLLIRLMLCDRWQACPRIGKCMYSILSHCQRKVGSWVGSSVIHLGDHNVPNGIAVLSCSLLLLLTLLARQR